MEATSEVRAWILRHPESTDAQRLPLFLDTLLGRLGIAEADRPAAAERTAREHGRANLWSSPAEGAGETLEELHARGYRLGVVSNADGRVRRILEDAGLASRLDFVIDSAEVGFEKPDPRIFRTATDRIGLPPEACAYVGDIYEIDVAGAKAAGLVPILIGACPAPEAVERIRKLRDLLGLFQEIEN